VVIFISKKGRTSRKNREKERHMSERKQIKAKAEYLKGPKKKSSSSHSVVSKTSSPIHDSNNPLRASTIEDSVYNSVSHFNSDSSSLLEFPISLTGWHTTERTPFGYNNGLVMVKSSLEGLLKKQVLYNNQPLDATVADLPTGYKLLIRNSSDYLLLTISGFDDRKNIYHSITTPHYFLNNADNVKANASFFSGAKRVFDVASRFCDSLFLEIGDFKFNDDFDSLKTASNLYSSITRNQINNKAILNKADFFLFSLPLIYVTRNIISDAQESFDLSGSYQQKLETINQKTSYLRELKKQYDAVNRPSKLF
jgi:hypothetical protein